MQTLEDLISSLEEKSIIKTEPIKQAFLKVDRVYFVPEEFRARAYMDTPLPIGEDQTISQPLTVALMLELLQPKSGDIVLDVGSGSGWTTALLAEIVGKTGRVFAIERIHSLKKIGEKNVQKLAYNNVSFLVGNGAKGWPEHAPYDKILVNAAGTRIPPDLKKQLKVPGRLIMPLSDLLGNIVVLDKTSEDNFKQQFIPGFSFVPFIEKD